MTTIQVINKLTFKSDYEKDMGSLMFPAKWYDCKHHVNMPKLRKELTKMGVVFPPRVKILGVLVPTTIHPDFKNEQNKKIPYKHPICASQTDAGAYYKTYPEMGGFAMWATDFPLGDAVIVINHPTFENVVV